ncbi:MAG TPA: YihY/virulence factor BrkB family protein [Conexibacter sp.]|nr:YihY/virulence factor BrkB family protein [Conexibacter sp.]
MSGYNCAVDLLTPVRALDRLQRRRSVLGFPLGVVKKFSDDQAGNLAALMAYYGFFSLFPLLLVFVTVLGYLLRDDRELYHDIVDSALGQFPVIGGDLRVDALGGSTVALVIGLVGAIWAGLGITLAGQRAMDQVWDVPHRLRRNFLTARLRGLLILLVLGALNVAITTAVGVLVGGLGGTALKVAGFAASALLDLALFWAVFRLFTSTDVPTRQLWLGIAIAAVGWAVLQTLGGIYVDRVVRRANATYGFFAIVIGVMSWLYLGAQMVLYAAEANVVRARRLWPRSLLEPVTAADVQALRAAARVEERREGERVEVTFEARPETPVPPPAAGPRE